MEPNPGGGASWRGGRAGALGGRSLGAWFRASLGCLDHQAVALN